MTGTFYACAYLGFGVPLLLSVAGGTAGFRGPLLALTLLTAVLAAALALPSARRLVTPAAEAASRPGP